jgi:hypothetical protein
MNSLFQLDIPKRNAACFAKGERLIPDMEVVSLLIETETRTVTRRDFCLACWAELPQESIKEAQGYWKSKIERKERPQSSNRVERALHLLQQSLKDAEPDEVEIFVLSLFLAHARQLILRKEFSEGGKNYHLYEIAKQDEFVTIRLIDLTQTQIDQKQKSLALKLM